MPLRRLLPALAAALASVSLGGATNAGTADAAARHGRPLRRTPAPAPSAQQRAALLRGLTGLSPSQVAVALQWCAQRCVPLRLRDGAYRLGSADAGAYLRAQVTLRGPGGVTTGYSPLVGPVASATAGAARVRLGAQATIRA